MNMKLFKMLIFLPLFPLLLAYPETASCENWLKYEVVRDGSVLSYDKDSIADRTRHIKQIWFKREVSDQSREILIKRMKAQGFPTAGYDKLSHHIVLFVINCKEKKYKALSTADIDINGKELFRNSSIEQPNWEDVVSDNIMIYGLYEAACNPTP